MITGNLPPRREMYRALVEKDPEYEGVFFVGVRTTGIFCRPTCPARKPREENVEFFPAARDALASGYRPCKRCRPLEMAGQTPGWLRDLVDRVERDPSMRWKDANLRAISLDPARVRRWFKAHHGMTFHAYLRARRLGMGLDRIREGADLTDTAYEAGYESPSGFRDAFERLFGATPGRSRGTTVVRLERLPTPLGPMLAGATGERLCLLEFLDRRMLETQLRRVASRLDARLAPGTNSILKRLAGELSAYFDGTLKRFSVPLEIPGTPFQERVWKRLTRIPYGQTLSYRQLAEEIGRPGAQRAVGRANGANRVAIIVPCHRVVRSDGTLSGYGGGVWRKRALLEHEGAAVQG
jgi:AraC family transcriptional regulator of adaptative response/methylated-DNA-[protein]-cysteine methyltransferase